MKLFAIFAVLNLAFLALLPFTLGEVDRFRLEIEEKGTTFTEEIEIDEKRNVQVFRVPAHNNVSGADFYHDFRLRVTVKRIPSRNVCYIAEMDPSLPSPGKLKSDIKRAASQPGKLPITTESTMEVVIGPADRPLLTKEILDFCGALPIYNTDVYSWNPAWYDPSNETGIIRTLRKRRQAAMAPAPTTIVTKFKSCLSMTEKNEMSHVEDCMEDSHWDISCKMESSSCFYFVTCEKTETRYDWTCKEVHSSSANPSCCDYVCHVDKEK